MQSIPGSLTSHHHHSHCPRRPCLIQDHRCISRSPKVLRLKIFRRLLPSPRSAFQRASRDGLGSCLRLECRVLFSPHSTTISRASNQSAIFLSLIHTQPTIGCGRVRGRRQSRYLAAAMHLRPPIAVSPAPISNPPHRRKSIVRRVLAVPANPHWVLTFPAPTGICRLTQLDAQNGSSSRRQRARLVWY